LAEHAAENRGVGSSILPLATPLAGPLRLFEDLINELLGPQLRRAPPDLSIAEEDAPSGLDLLHPVAAIPEHPPGEVLLLPQFMDSRLMASAHLFATSWYSSAARAMPPGSARASTASWISWPPWSLSSSSQENRDDTPA
jgi:hypothetical protein